MFAVLLAACGALPFADCGRAPGPRPAGWEIGYWYWRAAPGVRPAPAAVVPDVLYVQVGTLTPASLHAARWPEDLPAARAYVATWRQDAPAPPPLAAIAPLVRAYRAVRAEADAAGVRVVGLQLDVDCPTGSLAAYGDFLRRLRAELGAGERVSVTALLDWFRPGTGVRAVTAQVDEYVPQFYDAAPGGPHAEIAARVDHREWAPVFEALGRPYRLGLSTFGRIQRVRTAPDGTVARQAFRDLTLGQLAAAGLRPAGTHETRAGERLVRFDVARPLTPVLVAGDRVEAVVPTQRSVREAYDEARRFGGLCAGVVFFRWPARAETLAQTPDEIAGVLAATARADRLEAVDAGCRPLACADLRVRLRDRFAVEPLRLHVEASAEVEYLVPARAGITMRQTSPRTITLEIPPLLGEAEPLAGRAFSKERATYRLKSDAP